jgi:hypothetical protein
MDDSVGRPVLQLAGLRVASLLCTYPPGENTDVINAAVRCGDQVRATHSRLPTTHALVQDAEQAGGVHV